MSTPQPNVFLFSIDLEDVRDFIPGGHQYREAVPANTLKYLDWLDKIKSKATFFIVGKTARDYPDLIREIIRRGHETACHTDTHIHLTKTTPDQFRKDLESFMTTLDGLGATSVKGFRAPTFSMTEESKWAYAVLREFGFSYSSSVLPSTNPLFGWPQFKGEGFYDGIYELPMNIGSWPVKVPFGGGVYFRFLPSFILNSQAQHTFSKGGAVLSYFHPYDVDTDQEPFMHPHMNDSKVLNWLMYVNRGKVFSKAESLLQHTGALVMRYDEYLASKISRQ